MPRSHTSSISSSLLLGFLQKAGLAFLALYSAQAQEVRDQDNSTSLALSSDGGVFSQVPELASSFDTYRPSLEFTPPPALPAKQYSEKATEEFYATFLLLSAYQKFQDKHQAFARWWKDQNIAIELAKGVNPNVYPELMFMAIEVDHAEAIDSIIDQGADVSLLGSSQLNAINYAFNLHRLNAVRIFYRKNLINWDASDSQSMRPLYYGLVTTRSPAVFIKALHQEGIIDFNDEFRYRENVRKLVLSHDDPELFELGFLLPGKAPVNNTEAYQTILYESLIKQIGQKKWSIIEFVLNADSSKWVAPFDINTQRASHNGKTLLMAAMEAKAKGLVKKLLMYPEINLQITDKDKRNGVHYAAIYGFYDEIQSVSTRQAIASYFKKDVYQKFPADYHYGGMAKTHIPECLQDYLPGEMALIGSIKDAANQKLNKLFAKFMHGRANVEGQDFQVYLNSPDINPLIFLADLEKVRIADSSKMYGYTSIIEYFSFLLYEQAFESDLIKADAVDWTHPSTASSKNWLLLRQDLKKIELLYSHYKNKGQGNIFDVRDIVNARPIDILLVQSGATAQAPSLDYIEKLEALGVTHLAEDVIQDQFTRRHLSRSDNFELVSRFLPEPSHPKYQSIVYDIAMYAIKHEKWKVVSGLIDLPEFDINTQRAEYEGQTLLISLIRAKAWPMVERLLNHPKINILIWDKHFRNALHYAFINNAPEQIALKIAEMKPLCLAQRDMESKKAVDYAPSHMKHVYEGQVKSFSEKIHALVKDKMPIFEELMTTLKNAPDDYQQHGAAIEQWWEKNNISELTKYSLNEFITLNTGERVTHQLIISGSAEHLRKLMVNEDVNWSSFEYLVAVLNAGGDNISKAKLVYEWGVNHGLGNIFYTKNKEGFTPLRYLLNSLLDKIDVNSYYSLKEGGSLNKSLGQLDQDGILNFKREFGMSLDELVAQDFASYKKSIQTKVSSEDNTVAISKYSSRDIYLMTLGVGLPVIAIWAIFRGFIKSFFKPEINATEVRPQAQTQVPRRRQRAPTPAQQAVAPAEPENPLLLAARRQQAELISDQATTRLLIERTAKSRSEAEARAESYDRESDVGKLYVQLIAAYADSHQKQQALINAITSAHTAIDAFMTSPDNQALLQAKQEAIQQVSLLKAEAQAAVKMCHDAEAAIKKAEDAQAHATREAERATERQQRQKQGQSEEQKLKSLSDEFTAISAKTDLLPLAKRKLMREIIDEIKRLKLDERKIRPKVSACEKTLRDYHESVERQIAGLRIPGILAKAENHAIAVIERIEMLDNLQALMKKLGEKEPELDADYKRAAQLLSQLELEKHQYQDDVSLHAERINAIASNKDLLIAERLREAKIHMTELEKAVYQLSLSPDEIKSSSEILEGLQSEYDKAPALPKSTAASGAGKEHKPVEGKRFVKSYLNAVQYTCQLLHHQLNQLDPELRSEADGDDTYVKENAFHALIYNFARLLELLKDQPAEVGGARELRNQLIHRYYQAMTKKDSLIALVQAFTDDKLILVELQKPGAGDLGKRIKSSDYFKVFCVRREDYRIELRDYASVENEFAAAVKGISKFADNITWNDPVKGADLDADSKSLLRDSAKMRVIILGELLKGRHKEALLKKLSEQGYDDKKFWEQLEEDSAGNIKALRDNVMEARNIGAHHVKNTFSFRGLFDVTPAISIYVIKDLADKLKGLLPQEAPRGGTGGPSLAFGSTGAAGGASRLNPSASTWEPAFGGAGEYK